MKIAVAAACVVVFSGCGVENRETAPEPMKTTPLVQAVPTITETPPATKASAWDAGATTGTTLSSQDQTFLTDVALRGLVEVHMGNLVLEKGTHTEVRNFAWRMVVDYSSMNAQVAQLAAAKRLNLPTATYGEYKIVYVQLTKLTGEPFDNAYMYHMANTANGLAAFERASTSADDADVKAFAIRMLSVLRNHVPMATQAAETFHRDANRVIKIQ